ncbi:MAG: hypothetical protein MHM6MM_004034 [Cercozoa sp. M6MM]
MSPNRFEWAGLVVQLAGVVGFGYLTWRMLDHSTGAATRREVEKQRKELVTKLRKLGRRVDDDFSCDEYEAKFFDALVYPSQIKVDFSCLAGSPEFLLSVRDTVVEPLQHLSESMATPEGVLFYGPPGTGKTMLARCIAKECNATFLNVSYAQLKSKFVGDSEKNVSAMFTLARKLAPTVIFIDEIDALLKSRSVDMQFAASSSSMKATFLSSWDGLLEHNDPSKPVIVIGATNRAQDIDEAFLRRFSRRFAFHLPETEDRCDVVRMELLRLMKKDMRLRFEIEGRSITCDELAQIKHATWLSELGKITEGYSHSDLCKMVQAATQLLLRKHRYSHAEVPPLTWDHLMRGYRMVKPPVTIFDDVRQQQQDVLRKARRGQQIRAQLAAVDASGID